MSTNPENPRRFVYGIAIAMAVFVFAWWQCATPTNPHNNPVFALGLICGPLGILYFGWWCYKEGAESAMQNPKETLRELDEWKGDSN
jgi:hypothetical protein